MAVQRLVTNAEEVAFNDDSLPSGKSEEMVLNWHLSRLVKHGRLSAFQRFVQQVFDGFAVKYMASAVALLLYAAPLYFKDPSMRGTQDDLTQVRISLPALASLSCACTSSSRGRAGELPAISLCAGSPAI